MLASIDWTTGFHHLRHIHHHNEAQQAIQYRPLRNARLRASYNNTLSLASPSSAGPNSQSLLLIFPHDHHDPSRTFIHLHQSLAPDTHRVSAPRYGHARLLLRLLARPAIATPRDFTRLRQVPITAQAKPQPLLARTTPAPARLLRRATYAPCRISESSPALAATPPRGDK